MANYSNISSKNVRQNKKKETNVKNLQKMLDRMKRIRYSMFTACDDRAERNKIN